MGRFDPEDESSPTYYLTWYWRKRGIAGRLPPSEWIWLPRDPLFHEYAEHKLGWEPDPVYAPADNAAFMTRLVAAADLWRYLRMRHHEGKRMFSVERDDDGTEEDE